MKKIRPENPVVESSRNIQDFPVGKYRKIMYFSTVFTYKQSTGLTVVMYRFFLESNTVNVWFSDK